MSYLAKYTAKKIAAKVTTINHPWIKLGFGFSSVLAIKVTGYLVDHRVYAKYNAANAKIAPTK